MGEVVFQIVLIVFLVLFNGLFAMTEIAIVSSRKAVLQARAEAGSKGAARALKLAEEPGRFLSTVQIGITLVGVFAGASAGAKLSAKLTGVLEGVPVVGGYAEEIAFVVVIGAITFVSLVLGELAPKRVAIRFPEGIASVMSGPMAWLSKVASPFVSLLSWSTTALMRLCGVKDDKGEKLSRDEFTVLIREGMVAGGIAKAESRMMEGVLAFEKLVAYDIMIPRPKMVWIEKDEEHVDVWPRIAKSAQGFFPVYEKQWDNLVGVVSVKDCYAQLAAGADVRFQNLMQAPLLVPEVQKAAALLEQFRETGHHAAFVVDEFGGVTGMVTLLDLMEAVVGDVPSKEERITLPIRKREDGSWLVDGLVEIEKLPDHLEGFDLPTGGGDEFQTPAGWFSHVLGRVPAEGDVIEESGWRFEIVDMDGSRVDKVLAMKLPEMPPADDEED
jgi:putative hemolysin